MDEKELQAFAESHKVGFCKMPRGFSSMPFLGVPQKFMVPSRIDCRDLFTRTEDQGSKPWCAAYAAAQWAENVMWRVNDYPEEVDPAWIYQWAKAHDGNPTGSGTTLTAVLEALRVKMFKRECRVQVLRPNRLAFKYALHKFGCCLCGFDIDSSWWGLTKENPVVSGQGTPHCGGHAVCAAGYSKDYVYLVNSWGVDHGEYGHIKMPWAVFDKEIMYGAVLSNCLDGLKINM